MRGTSVDGGLLAPGKLLPLRLDGILLESWKAKGNSPRNELGLCEVFTCHYLVQILFGCFGLNRVKYGAKRERTSASMNETLPRGVTKWPFRKSLPLRWEPAGEVTISVGLGGQA